MNNKDIDIATISTAPALFEEGNATFWNDPYISIHLLEAHLDENRTAASRPTAIIDRHIDNLISSGLVKPGDNVLDLGCGPGLYSRRLAAAGANVTGVDFSPRSIAYAREQAEEHGLDIEYSNDDFFTIDYHEKFDVAMQIYGEMNTFSDEKRDALLLKIRNSLKPGGLFIFDVTTRELRKKEGLSTNWYAATGGFWRPGNHLVLERGFDYPEHDTWLDQHVVIENGTVSVYRNWFHDYSAQEIQRVLETAGFTVRTMWSDLSGTPYIDGGDWIAIVAEKI